MTKQCKNCTHFPIGSIGFGNCQKIDTTNDVRTQGFKLQVNESFSCKYFKKRDNGTTDNSNKN